MEYKKAGNEPTLQSRQSNPLWEFVERRVQRRFPPPSSLRELEFFFGFFFWLPEGCFNFPLHTVRHMYDITGGKKMKPLWRRSKKLSGSILPRVSITFYPPPAVSQYLSTIFTSRTWGHAKKEKKNCRDKLTARWLRTYFFPLLACRHRASRVWRHSATFNMHVCWNASTHAHIHTHGRETALKTHLLVESNEKRRLLKLASPSGFYHSA